MSRGRVKCEAVREVLPEYAEPGPRPAGPVEQHLASCAACGAELASYRGLLSSLADLRERDLDPSPAFVDETLMAVRVDAVRRRLPTLGGVRRAGSRAIDTVREHGTAARYALVSLGGAAVGATAIAIVWWSVTRRGLPTAPSAATLVR